MPSKRKGPARPRRATRAFETTQIDDGGVSRPSESLDIREFLNTQGATGLKHTNDLLELVDDHETARVFERARSLLDAFTQMPYFSQDEKAKFPAALRAAFERKQGSEKMASGKEAIVKVTTIEYPPVINAVIWLAILMAFFLTARTVVNLACGIWDFIDPTPLLENGVEVVKLAVEAILKQNTTDAKNNAFPVIEYATSPGKLNLLMNFFPQGISKHLRLVNASENATAVEQTSDFSDPSASKFQIVHDGIVANFVVNLNTLTGAAWHSLVQPYLSAVGSNASLGDYQSGASFHDLARAARFRAAFLNLGASLVPILTTFTLVMKDKMVSAWHRPERAGLFLVATSALAAAFLFYTVRNAPMDTVYALMTTLQERLTTVAKVKFGVATLFGGGSFFSGFFSGGLKTALTSTTGWAGTLGAGALFSTFAFLVGTDFQLANDIAAVDALVASKEVLMWFLQIVSARVMGAVVRPVLEAFAIAATRWRGGLPLPNTTEISRAPTPEDEARRRALSRDLRDAERRVFSAARSALRATNNDIEAAARFLVESGVI